MTRKKILTSLALSFTGLLSTQAATLSINGTVFSFQGFDNETIQNGSTVQVGYFLGIDANLAPTSYTATEWGTFTPVASFLTGDVVEGAFSGGAEINTTVESEVVLPSGTTPVRVGVRVFDNLESGRYNTFIPVADRSILELPSSSVPPVAGTGEADIGLNTFGQPADSFWEDNANQFQTTLAIPEPSSSLSLLLGGLLLLGKRRRS